MADYHRVIGIDLGTTFSVVAAFSFTKQDVKVIPNRQNEPTTPSVVYIGKDGRVSVGRAARERLARDPKGVIFEVKRLMGDQRDGRKATVSLGDRKYDPEFISALILKELKACAETVIGEPIHDAVITVPAYFKEPQKHATREAAKIAKLNPRLIINEPTAAAVAYGLDSGEAQTFVVFDFGGGTFDVSVVRILDEQTVEVLGTGGDAHLGGGDIDQKIVDWVLDQMKREYGRDFRGNDKLVGRIHLKAEQVKILLSNERRDQEFYLDNPTSDIEEVDHALESAHENHDLTLDDVDAFILVGGSSKISQVAEALRAKYKKQIKSDLNPDEIVAIGAARIAMNYEPSLAADIRDAPELDFAPQPDEGSGPPPQLTDTHIKDVVSHTLGIGLKDDVYDPLIPRDHVIPHRVIRSGYTTAEDDQTGIYVPVYQGDNPKASYNFQLGEVVIDALEPKPKGIHQFQITFALDADGIFTGEVKHLQTSQVTPIKLDRGEGMLTEKRRVELAEIVERGIIGPDAGAPTGPAEAGAMPAPTVDPVLALINQARAIQSTLQAHRQRELADLLRQLEQARASNDINRLGGLIAQVSMIVMNARTA
ncbi:MAG: Hsp70 family protein [Singulisphaera sp.]|nr:Hsp70 family protein [Singulisphaera sp.]